MKIFNCHTHSMFSHDGKGTVGELCKAAIQNNLSGFAVTDHCDCEYDNDITMLENLNKSFSEAEKYKDLYNGRLIISKGLEIGEALFNPEFAKKHLTSFNYDVVLGSVHAVRVKNFEMPFSIIDFSDKTDEFIEGYIRQYFEDLLETARSTDYDILCHLTVVLRYIVYKFNRNIDIKKHFPIIEEILKAVINRDKTLEVNTSGFTDGYFMPDAEIIRMYKKLGGRKITLGSDAHIPCDISKGLATGADMLKNMGFNELTYYEKRCPFTYKI